MAHDTKTRALPTKIEQWTDPQHNQTLINKVLSMAKDRGASAAEVGCSQTLGLTTHARLGELESVEFEQDKSVGLTVYVGQQRGSASTTDLSEKGLEATLSAALSIAKMTQPDPYSGLAEPEKMATQIVDCDLYHPWALELDAACDLAIEAESAGLNDPKIKNSEGASVSTSQSYVLYANSNGFMGAFPTSRHSLSCVLIAEKAGAMERDYAYRLSRDPKKLPSAVTIGEEARDKTLARLGAKTLSSQKCSVIFHHQLAGGFLSSFFSAISGGALYRQQSFLLNSLGEQIFPEFMDIIQYPHEAGCIGSAPFDDDGLQTRQQAFVKAGCVENYLLGTYSARKLGMESTANAGGLLNTKVTPTAGDLDSLLADMGKGLLVTELMGSGVNLTTGDYSRGASGFWVEGGKIQYPVHGITIAGNLKTLYRDIMAIGSDIDWQHVLCTGSIWVKEMSIAGQ